MSRLFRWWHVGRLAWPWLLGCGCGGSGPPCPASVTDIRLPEDENPHPVTMEWWYFTGHLWDERQDRFGFEVSFFQTRVSDMYAYVAHFAISDPKAAEHIYDQRAAAPPERWTSLAFDLGGWTLERDGTIFRMAAAMPGGAVDLALSDEKDAAIHNGDGRIEMGGGGLSYYYSTTRLAASGTLEMGGQRRAVQGIAWHDHQWGDFDVFASRGWDWFSLQFDDGAELMLFVLRTRDGSALPTGGTWVDAAGCARDIASFSIAPHRTWHSPHTGADYPMDWTIAIAELELDIEVRATFDDQEMDSRATTLNTYWEGEVTASGTRTGKPVNALGYVELAGYGPWGP